MLSNGLVRKEIEKWTDYQTVQKEMEMKSVVSMKKLNRLQTKLQKVARSQNYLKDAQHVSTVIKDKVEISE